ncbi:MAG TPA: carboxypeptidase regulatory-like domain-containing protein [Planctomycetes bacterium]|nr:carboxypeptidase regulatory-like domain-containing protein [Planctomycetota bacterium]
MKKKRPFLSLFIILACFVGFFFLLKILKEIKEKNPPEFLPPSFTRVNGSNEGNFSSEKKRKPTQKNGRRKQTSKAKKQNLKGQNQWRFWINNLYEKEKLVIGFYSIENQEPLFSKAITPKGLWFDKGKTYRIHLMTPGYSFIIQDKVSKTFTISETNFAVSIIRHPTIQGTVLTEDHLPAPKVIVYPVDSKGRRLGWYGISNKEGHFVLKLENYLNKDKKVFLKGVSNKSFAPTFDNKEISWGDTGVTIFVKTLSTLQVIFRNPVPLESQKNLGVSLSENVCFHLRKHSFLEKKSFILKGLFEGEYKLSILDNSRMKYFGPETIKIQKGKNFFRANLKDPIWQKVPIAFLPKKLKQKVFFRIHFLQNEQAPFLRRVPLFSPNLFSGCNGVLWETPLIHEKQLRIPILFPNLKKWLLIGTKEILLSSIPFQSHISFPPTPPKIPKNTLVINLHEADDLFRNAPSISRLGIIRFSLHGKGPFHHWPAFGKHQKIHKKRFSLRGVQSGPYTLSFSLPWISQPLYHRKIQILPGQKTTLNISLKSDLKLGSIHFTPPKPFHPNDFLVTKVGEKRRLLSFVIGKALYTPLLQEGKYSIQLKREDSKDLKYQRIIHLLPGQTWKGK